MHIPGVQPAGACPGDQYGEGPAAPMREGFFGYVSFALTLPLILISGVKFAIHAGDFDRIGGIRGDCAGQLFLLFGSSASEAR